MPIKVYPRVFKFRGGQLALDFANTVHWHRRPAPVELLDTYAQWVAWARAAGLLTRAQGAQLLARAEAEPRAAERARQHALALREAIYRLCVAAVEGRRPAPADLERLHQALTEAAAWRRLTPGPAGYAWRWTLTDHLRAMLGPVAQAAADLLASPQLGRVRQCADERGCGWLFLDTTKNGQRRYCASADCGAINKARRYYRRQRAARTR